MHTPHPEHDTTPEAPAALHRPLQRLVYHLLEITALALIIYWIWVHTDAAAQLQKKADELQLQAQANITEIKTGITNVTQKITDTKNTLEAKRQALMKTAADTQATIDSLNALITTQSTASAPTPSAAPAATPATSIASTLDTLKLKRDQLQQTLDSLNATIADTQAVTGSGTTTPTAPPAAGK